MEYVARGGAFEHPRIYRTSTHTHCTLHMYLIAINNGYNPCTLTGRKLAGYLHVMTTTCTCACTALCAKRVENGILVFFSQSWSIPWTHDIPTLSPIITD